MSLYKRLSSATDHGVNLLVKSPMLFMRSGRSLAIHRTFIRILEAFSAKTPCVSQSVSNSDPSGTYGVDAFVSFCFERASYASHELFAKSAKEHLIVAPSSLR